VSVRERAMNKLRQDKPVEQNNTATLREYTSNLNRVLQDLRRTMESSSMDEEHVQRIRDLEGQFSTINQGITELIHSLPSKPSNEKESEFTVPVILRVKQWEDFKALASNANTVSFIYRPEEKTFQVDALKGGRVYTFSGQIPSDVNLLIAWLSQELRVEERRVLEGVLSLG
jgi:hypothetical protein